MSDNAFYLNDGKQTLRTSEVIKIVLSFRGNDLEKINKIMAFVKSLKYSGFDERLFRKRTASQIIEDGFITGCTDSDLVFVALSRACGIPAKYVETIDASWLKDGSDNSIHGHQYAEVWLKKEKKWIWVDPMGGRVDTPPPGAENRVIYKIGLDSWDIGITDFTTLRQLFIAFKRKQPTKN